MAIELGNRLQMGTILSPQEAKAFVSSIRQETLDLADRTISRGQFMQELSKGTLSKEALRIFWLNWHGFVCEINNYIQVAYQRHLGFFKRHIDLLTCFADKVADELIHPKPPGHLLLVWKQGEIFGLTRDQMMEYEMLPKCRVQGEWYCGLLYEGTMLEFWSSLLVEEYIGIWAGQFRDGLLKMGYSKDQVPYFTTHEEADLQEHEGGIMAHGEFNRTVLERLLTTGHVDCRPGFSPRYVALTSVELLALTLDASLEAARAGAGGRIGGSQAA